MSIDKDIANLIYKLNLARQNYKKGTIDKVVLSHLLDAFIVEFKAIKNNLDN